VAGKLIETITTHILHFTDREERRHENVFDQESINTCLPEALLIKRNQSLSMAYWIIRRRRFRAEILAKVFFFF